MDLYVQRATRDHGLSLHTQVIAVCHVIVIIECDEDRKSTRLNSSHLGISYAVFCLKKKKNQVNQEQHQDHRQDGSEAALKFPANRHCVSLFLTRGFSVSAPISVGSSIEASP